MKASALLLLSAVSAARVTPVQKVIQMLNDMRAQGQKELDDEEVKYSAYEQWCKNTKATMTSAISDETDLIEKLTAEIAEHDQNAATADRQAKEKVEAIATWKADRAAATVVRDAEKADFLATQAEYADNISAVERAINTLKKQNYDREQAALLQSELSLIQTGSHMSLKSANQALMRFLQPGKDADYGNRSAPKANAYEFASGGVIEMLKSLEDKFNEEKSALEKEEQEAQFAFEKLLQNMQDNIENDTTIMKRRNATRDTERATSAEKSGEKKKTEDDKAADTKFLSDTTTECKLKAEAFAARNKLRREELDSIDQAVEILSSDKVSGAADRNLPAMMLLQMRSKLTRGEDNIQTKVAELLSARAEKFNSQVLSMLAIHATADPFKKVKKMIREMISKLMQEATAEQEHHGWCQAELGANKITREDKTATAEELTATKEGLEADIATLTEEIATLSAEVTELSKDRAEATKVRNESNAQNTQVIKEAKEAQVAVTEALTVLKEFYAKAGEATALVQQPVSESINAAPETFEKPYKGMGGENGGVVGMLEVIQSDFARLESETISDEELESENYTKFMNDSEVDKAVKETDIQHKQGMITKKNQSLSETKTELATTNEELAAANEYYEKLRPQCVDTGMTYEERVQKREEEIQSLKEAMEMLKDM